MLLAVMCVIVGLSVRTFAQDRPSSITPDNPLPDAPQPAQNPASDTGIDLHLTGDGTISGTVLDASGGVVQGSRVTLEGPPGTAPRTVESGNDGQFVFSGLAADIYKVSVAATGMSLFNSKQIQLHEGEAYIMPPITLSVSGGATSVTVSGNKEDLSKQQVQIAVQQRIAGVIPNFYSAYDWNAPPMLAKQKVQLGVRSVIDPVSFLAVAGVAGAEQYKNVFPGYGSGFEGYGKRYAAALANHASSTLLGRAVYPAIFHQDPRYFYKGKGSVGSRLMYAISAAVIARGDNGRWEPNYSRVLGNFTSAAISNLYYPEADRGGSLILLNGLATTGGDVVANVIREFLLKRVTSHVPGGANGEP